MEHSGSRKQVPLAAGQRAAPQAGTRTQTDQKDREWIADLLQHGMLKGSFLPLLPIRRLRDLTRTRAKIRQTMAAFANRMQKLWEDRQP